MAARKGTKRPSSASPAPPPPKRPDQGLGSALPPAPSVLKLPDLPEPPQQYVRHYAQDLLRECDSTIDADAVFDAKLGQRVVMLDNPAGKLKSRHRTPRRGPSRAAAKQPIPGLPDAPPKYETFLGLHALWSEYMAEALRPALENTKDPNHTSIQTKLLKADYHGAFLTVIRSKQPSFVGRSGIVVHETSQTFQVITPDNVTLTLPKPNSVFSFSVCGLTCTLYGNHIRYKGTERTVRKFKSKSSIDL
eukprot:m.74442 g.74442  ORF g.74442 m.74442 type:complete len:248 (+) comp8053_c0_seq2:2521-3264(+)